jgi:cytochrome b561
MAALILFQLGLGVWMTAVVADLGTRFDLTQLHKSWGFVVFALALLRLVWRALNPATPAPPPGTPRWQIRAAAWSHRALYALMLALPLTGWAMSAASPVQDLLGMENMVFGLFALPDPWRPGVEWVEAAAARAHLVAAVALAALLALHAGAALKHQFLDHDGVLARMAWGR